MEDHAPGRFRRIQTLIVEASGPPAVLDLAEADEWRCVVTYRGTPCAYVAVPSPGAGSGPSLVESALARHAGPHMRERAAREGLRRRLGSPDPPAPPLRRSVVVCTHRRSEFLPAMLESLARLDPAPDEVIIVDNDPGPEDCRMAAERAGARYVREDRRGLNRARATGLRAARGDVVAFTDDDCIVPPGWLRTLPEVFADPTVAAVTGPGFAHELETAHQLHREETAGFVKEFRRRTFDWTNVWPVHSGQIGTGANMIFRRTAVGDPDALFPPELDAGTATRSGGDLYALFAVLAAGHRIVYDPAVWFLHRHRPDRASLEDTIDGYGIGLSAFLSKALVEDREISSFAVWWWLWRSYVRALLGSWSGYGDPAQVRLRSRYLRAGWLGMPAWLRARKDAGAAAPPAAAAPGRTEPPGPQANPPEDVAVIVASTSPERLARCLRALATEAAAEIVVAGPTRPPSGVRWVQCQDGASAALAAGVAVATATVVLLLDDRLTPRPGLVFAHARAHAGAEIPRLVTGYSPHPLPARPGLASIAARLEREDHFRLIREAATPTCAGVELRNVSLRRADLERIGGVDGRLGELAAGLDLGIRALAAGLEVVHEPAAAAGDDVHVTTRSYVEVAHTRGRGAAALAGKHPAAAGALAEPQRVPAPLDRVAVIALTWPWARAAVHPLLHALEGLRLRRSWARLAWLARRGGYRHGVRVAAPGGLPAPPVMRVDLDEDALIPAPGPCAPLVDLRLRGRRVALVRPPRGHWHHDLFGEALDGLRDEDVSRIPAAAATGRGTAAHAVAITVVLTDPAAAPTLASTGASVSLVEGKRGARERWQAIDRAIRSAPTEAVALPLPGTHPSPEWLAGVREALGGDRVAAAVGCGLHPHERAGPVGLVSRRLRHGPYAMGGRPAQFVAVRRARYAELGGFDPATATLGSQGPVLDLVERALEAGLVTAYCETPGLTPAGAHRPARSRNEFEAWVARGGLLARDAAALGPLRGVPWLATRALLPRMRMLWLSIRTGEPSARHWSGSTAGMICGLLLAAMRSRAPAPPRPEPEHAGAPRAARSPRPAP
ncbi:MAG: glycosyltransferase family 2 protein [Thermoleophilaceae bacterium]